MIVYKLTIEQKEQLVGQQYAPDCFFNPIQDADGHWIITEQEVDNCTNDDFDWIGLLPTIPYQPKPFTFSL